MTFVSCVSENDTNELNGLNSTSAFAIFFLSKGSYYMPKGHIGGLGELRSTLRRSFHAVTLFIGPLLAWRRSFFDESRRL